MRILLVHNYYRERGGEYRVFLDEAEMLLRHSHEVTRYTRHNDETLGMNPIRLAGKTIWNRDTYSQIRDLIRSREFDIVHVHNTLALVSPAVFYAARDSGVPAIQTLHNFRLVCANGLLFRDGRICEDCLSSRLPLPALRHSCYRSSRTATAGVTAMTTLHRLKGTWSRVVSGFITLNSQAKETYIRYGIPPEKLYVKANAIDLNVLPGEGKGGYALYVGRMVPEKGVDTLIKAWSRSGTRIPLKMVGDGPLLDDLRKRTRDLPIELSGLKSREEILALMREASFLVFPSTCYEGFSRVPIEALSMGTPVVASRLGAVVDVVKDGKTGFLFEAGNEDSLADTIRSIETDPSLVSLMRPAARQDAVSRFGDDTNHDALLSIYRSVIDRVQNLKKSL